MWPIGLLAFLVMWSTATMAQSDRANDIRAVVAQALYAASATAAAELRLADARNTQLIEPACLNLYHAA
jgi:hypothetical protein